MRLRALSLNTTTAMRSLSRTAVSISASVMPRPPSPVKAMTSRAGEQNAAAMAAGSANPIVARPLEISRRRGSVTSHNGMTASMCAPASTVTIVSGGACSRTTVTTCTGDREPGRAAVVSDKRSADWVLASWPALGGQSCSRWFLASTLMAAGSGMSRAVAPGK